MHHAKRVSDSCEWFAKTIDCSREQTHKVKSAGFIHDIGKMILDEKVLGKLGNLTDKEFEYLKKHPGDGATLIKHSHRYHEMSQIIIEHHERWDGLGYPRGLKGNQIIKEARIIAICDAYDAMTNDRIYRDAIGKDKAIDEINRCAGTQFDPILAEIFIDNIKYWRWYMQNKSKTSDVNKYYVHKRTGIRYTEKEFIEENMMVYRTDFNVIRMVEAENGKTYDLDKLENIYINEINYFDKKLYQIDDIELDHIDDNKLSCVVEAIDENGKLYIVTWDVIDPNPSDLNNLCDWETYHVDQYL